MRKRNPAVMGIKYLILITFALLCIYPIIWLLASSFKSNAELYSNPWGIAATFNLENYIRAWSVGTIGRNFYNSVKVAVPTVAITVLLSAMASYGLVRLKWKFSGIVMALFMLGLMIPQYSAIIPLFSIFNKLKLTDSALAVIIPNIVFTLPVGMMIIAAFFQTIPRELEEAAIIDGSGVIGAFFRIICPISVSALVTVAVISFITVWNDLLFPQIFLSSPEKMTLPVGLSAFSGRYSTDYVGMIAAVVITIIPSIIVYSVLHEKIMDGMTTGAVKG